MPRLTPTDWKTQVKIFEKDGFTIDRTKGDILMIKVNHITLLWLTYVAVFALSSLANAQIKKSIAVLDFAGRNISFNDAASLTDRLRSELVRTAAVTVVERSEMKNILSEQDFQLTGCTSDRCIVEVGQLLGVSHMIAGSIGKVGATFSIDIREIHVKTGRITRSVIRDYRGPIDGLLAEMRNVARELIGPRRDSSTSAKKPVASRRYPVLARRLYLKSSLYMEPLLGARPVKPWLRYVFLSRIGIFSTPYGMGVQIPLLFKGSMIRSTNFLVNELASYFFGGSFLGNITYTNSLVFLDAVSYNFGYIIRSSNFRNRLIVEIDGGIKFYWINDVVHEGDEIVFRHLGEYATGDNADVVLYGPVDFSVRYERHLTSSSMVTLQIGAWWFPQKGNWYYKEDAEYWEEYGIESDPVSFPDLPVIPDVVPYYSISIELF